MTSPIPAAALEFRRRREALGLTQAQLARWAKVPAPYVSNAEHGRCSTWALPRIRRALDRQEEWRRRCLAQAKLQRRVDEVWAAAPDCELVRLLRRQLVGRAWRLLLDGEAECADRLLELLPDDTREALVHQAFETDDWYPVEILQGAAAAMPELREAMEK